MTAQEIRDFVNNSETSHFEITYKEDVIIYKLSRYGAWKVGGTSKTKSKVAKRKYKAYIRTDINGFYFGYASKRKARTWYPVEQEMQIHKIESIKELFKKEVTISQEEINIRACKSFLNRCHKNLWKNIQESCKAYIENQDEKDLPDFIRWTAGGVRYASIKNKIPYNQDQIILELTNAIETNTPYKQMFGASAPQGRDRSFSIEIINGLTKGFFSSEYANCLNGDYWLLINPTTALYYEKD